MEISPAGLSDRPHSVNRKLPRVALKSIPKPLSIRQEAWQLLTAIEPACAALLNDARQTYRELKAEHNKRIPYDHLIRLFYDCFKPRLYLLAGHGSANPLLRSSACYDLLYERICDALHIDCCHEDALKTLEQLSALLRTLKALEAN